MSEDKSYRQIFKATTLFGGVQVVIVLFSIIRSKFVALWLGPEGVGVLGIFSAALSLIVSIVGLGVSSSSVRSLSEVNVDGDKRDIGLLVKIVRKLSLLLGFLGFILTILFSKFLSNVSFNTDFTFSYIFLAIAVFFSIWENGEMAILQGLRELKKLARANVVGSLLGVIFTLPIYYFFGISGIVPSIIVVYFFNAIVNYFFSRKLYNFEGSVDVRKHSIVKDILRIGISMSISSVLVYLVMFAIRIFIAERGNVVDVGYYQASFALLNGYVGLIFTAMAKDYYPRLSGVKNNDVECEKLVHQQIEIGLLLLFPIISILLVFIPFVIQILYSTDFLGIKVILYWSLLGIPLKMISWSYSYLVLAKGDMKSFLIYELVGNIVIFFSHVLAYEYWGIAGLGYAFLFSNLAYLIMVYLTVNRKYAMVLSKGVRKIFILEMVVLLIFVGIAYLFESLTPYLVSLPILLWVFYYSFGKLNDRLNIISLIKNYNRNK